MWTSIDHVYPRPLSINQSPLGGVSFTPHPASTSLQLLTGYSLVRQMCTPSCARAMIVWLIILQGFKLLPIPPQTSLQMAKHTPPSKTGKRKMYEGSTMTMVLGWEVPPQLVGTMTSMFRYVYPATWNPWKSGRRSKVQSRIPVDILIQSTASVHCVNGASQWSLPLVSMELSAISAAMKESVVMSWRFSTKKGLHLNSNVKLPSAYVDGTVGNIHKINDVFHRW